MESNGKIPSNKISIIIPARFGSTRLEGKALADISGKPLIAHVIERAREAAITEECIVATDDSRILQAAEAFGAKAVLTSPNHETGSDRIAEAVVNHSDAEIIVNLQGDEPLIDPLLIRKVVQALIENDWADVSTAFCDAASAEEVLSANTVKVVTAGEQAIYFSRSPIPFPRYEVEKYGSLRDALAGSKELVSTYKIHCGIYAYRRKVLEKFAETEPAELERTEKLEQLRALSFGAKFVIVRADSKSIGIDTKEDLEMARSLFSKKADTKTDKL